MEWNLAKDQEQVILLRSGGLGPGQTSVCTAIYLGCENQIKGGLDQAAAKTDIKEYEDSEPNVKQGSLCGTEAETGCAWSDDIRPPKMHLNRSSHIKRIKSARLSSESCFFPPPLLVFQSLSKRTQLASLHQGRARLIRTPQGRHVPRPPPPHRNSLFR